MMCTYSAPEKIEIAILKQRKPSRTSSNSRKYEKNQINCSMTAHAQSDFNSTDAVLCNVIQK